jgi:glucose/arabinose dehydrogenase
MTMAVRPPATADDAIYVGLREGTVQRVDNGTVTTALDIQSQVETGGECGLLGMTFSPDGSKLYVHYSLAATCATVVAEYAFDDTTHTAVTASARQVLTVSQPQFNHNGGSLLFGPDDLLYLALGDGGGGNDVGMGHVAGGNAQSLDTLLGKVLRIDPTPDPDVDDATKDYLIPPDNPFVGTPSATDREEIWSYGLRNPFRMSFDRTTGDLWIGDVGQNQREEIDWVAATDPVNPGGKGSNFGWNRREGDLIGPNPDQSTGPYTPPIIPINRSLGDTAIVGGYVYRGAGIPELAGAYLFSDFNHYAIRAARFSGFTLLEARDFGPGVGKPGMSSFGEDNDGELYVISLFSGVYRIDKV